MLIISLPLQMKIKNDLSDEQLPTTCENDNKLKEEESTTTTTDLWDALEEATSHLPPTGADESIVSGGTDTEMLQVDEIVNRVVGETAAHQAPSPL